MKTSLARRVFSDEEVDQVIDQVRARTDTNRPEHLRLAPHRPEFVARLVRYAVRKLGAGWPLAFLVGDYAYLEASGADPDEWTATAQALRIHRRVSEAGLRIRMSESRVSQLRTQACKSQPRPFLHAPDGKPLGGRGRAAAYALPEWLRVAYLVAEGKPESTVSKACTNPDETLRPSVRDLETRGREDTEVVPQSPAAPAAPRVAAEDAKAIFCEWWSRRYQGLRYEFSPAEERALISLVEANHFITTDDLQRRVSDYLATDGDDTCCNQAEERFLSGRADRRRHDFCTNYSGHQHPVAMFLAGINRFALRSMGP